MLVAKKTLADISDVARDLRHPSIVRVRRDAGDVHRSGGDVDEEQDVKGDESLERTHFDAQEISRRQAFPVSFEERRPSGVSVTLRSWLDAVFQENVGDGASANLMSQISQRARDPRVSPLAIFERHAHNEIDDPFHNARPTRGHAGDCSSTWTPPVADTIATACPA